jgi:hypothetical protein
MIICRVKLLVEFDYYAVYSILLRDSVVCYNTVARSFVLPFPRIQEIIREICDIFAELKRSNSESEQKKVSGDTG